MKQLLLLRHAQAEAALTQQPDKERALSTQGRAEALTAARCLIATGVHIDEWLVSPALRTRQTAQIIASDLHVKPDLHFDPSLYPGELQELLAAIQRCPSKAHSLLLVAHNPGISELASLCNHREHSIDLNPAGLCQVQFDAASWREFEPQAASACQLLR